MKLKRQMPGDEGSITVEASLIFPVVFLTIIAIIYFSMIIYQKVFIQVLADTAAQRGAVVWNNPAKDILIGSVSKSNIDSGGLYWRLIDSNEQSKEEKIRSYIQNRLVSHSVLGFSTKPKISVKMNNFIAYKILEINIDAGYKIPAGGVLKMFGLSDEYKIFAKSRAVINEPAEFIRNTDFVLDLEKEFEKSHAGYKEAIDNIRSSIDNIKDKVDKFFKEN